MRWFCDFSWGDRRRRALEVNEGANRSKVSTKWARDAFQMDDDAVQSVRLAWFPRRITLTRQARHLCVRRYRGSSAPGYVHAGIGASACRSYATWSPTRRPSGRRRGTTSVRIPLGCGVQRSIGQCAFSVSPAWPSPAC